MEDLFLFLEPCVGGGISSGRLLLLTGGTLLFSLNILVMYVYLAFHGHRGLSDGLGS